MQQVPLLLPSIQRWLSCLQLIYCQVRGTWWGAFVSSYLAPPSPLSPDAADDPTPLIEWYRRQLCVTEVCHRVGGWLTYLEQSLKQLLNCDCCNFVCQLFWDSCFFVNSRTAIAGAIIGLLLVFFYFVVMIFVTTIWRHSHFLFIRSCNFNWIACVTSFFALSGASFFVHARD